jgi:hypothetical protein
MRRSDPGGHVQPKRRSYPSASDVAQHGLQILPASLPLVDFEGARLHRRLRYVAMPASYLTPPEVLRLAEVGGTSFARREPQCRHLRPAKLPSAELREACTLIRSASPRSARGARSA